MKDQMTIIQAVELMGITEYESIMVTCPLNSIHRDEFCDLCVSIRPGSNEGYIVNMYVLDNGERQDLARIKFLEKTPAVDCISKITAVMI